MFVKFLLLNSDVHFKLRICRADMLIHFDLPDLIVSLSAQIVSSILEKKSWKCYLAFFEFQRGNKPYVLVLKCLNLSSPSLSTFSLLISMGKQCNSFRGEKLLESCFLFYFSTPPSILLSCVSKLSLLLVSPVFREKLRNPDTREKNRYHRLDIFRGERGKRTLSRKWTQ